MLMSPLLWCKCYCHCMKMLLLLSVVLLSVLPLKYKLIPSLHAKPSATVFKHCYMWLCKCCHCCGVNVITNVCIAVHFAIVIFAVTVHVCKCFHCCGVKVTVCNTATAICNCCCHHVQYCCCYMLLSL